MLENEKRVAVIAFDGPSTPDIVKLGNADSNPVDDQRRDARLGQGAGKCHDARDRNKKRQQDEYGAGRPIPIASGPPAPSLGVSSAIEAPALPNVTTLECVQVVPQEQSRLQVNAAALQQKGDVFGGGVSNKKGPLARPLGFFLSLEVG